MAFDLGLPDLQRGSLLLDCILRVPRRRLVQFKLFSLGLNLTARLFGPRHCGLALRQLRQGLLVRCLSEGKVPMKFLFAPREFFDVFLVSGEMTFALGGANRSLSLW